MGNIGSFKINVKASNHIKKNHDKKIQLVYLSDLPINTPPTKKEIDNYY